MDKLSKSNYSNVIELQNPIRKSPVVALKSSIEKRLIKEAFGEDDASSITYSYKATINNTSNF